MSYGNQLNIFRAQSNRYGADWRGIVCCPNLTVAKAAARDATEALGGRYSAAAQVLTLPNGSTLLFRVVTGSEDARRAFAGREFTQIAWLHRPDGPTADELITVARSRLRSQTVPAGDWRYEYCMVR